MYTYEGGFIYIAAYDYKWKSNSEFNHYRAYRQHKASLQTMLCINFGSKNCQKFTGWGVAMHVAMQAWAMGWMGNQHEMTKCCG